MTIEETEHAVPSKDAHEADLPGVIEAFGRMPRDALVTESGLASIFGRHPSSVMRAVERRELPPPVRLFNAKMWTVGTILDYLAARLAEAERKQSQMERRLKRISP